MNLHFCNYYRGDGMPPSNRYCRECSQASLACNILWQRVVDLSTSGEGGGIPLFGTNATMYPNPNNWEIVHLKINCRWNLPKEDFLHFIATGYARMGRASMRRDVTVSPSLTRQEPYVQAIVKHIGGPTIPEIQHVREVQRGEA